MKAKKTYGFIEKERDSMADIFELFENKEAFDNYWHENYIPITYEDVRDTFEEFVKAADRKIFLSDYEEAGQISRDDFMEHLSQTAEFTFQDSLTEVFYEKNPDLYENAFSIYEMSQMTGGDGNVASIFHEEYNRLYRAFLLAMYDACF
jgi:hypothetical protein